MIPELGHFALIIAFAISIVQSFVPLIGVQGWEKENRKWYDVF